MSATLLQSAPLATSPADSAAPTRWARRAGYALTGIAAALLALDMSMKLLGVKEAVEGTVQLGYQPHHLLIIGVLQAVCLALFLVPRTAPLGAILWTGYFGGAVATHLRLENPLFTHVLSGVYVSAMIWGGLYLRDARVRALLRPAR